ncbi:MAG: HAD hydrolase family protein [Hyphomonadaceae bacterium]|nr:HAD hydrolase family protein [Hyphomonadaceae bacterium]MCA8885392.1 HAD hydrolase family protein [Hyphomonadaceae bacterium]
MNVGKTKPLANRSLLLAVDLDGTFLGGSLAERRELYDFIVRHRDDIALVFVTGRDIAFASGLALHGEAPAPDIIIGDVGTSVVVGPEWAPHAAVEAWIDENWPGPERAAALLQGRACLAPQRVFGGRRLSYFYANHEDAQRAATEIEAAGYQALMSANVFFDVLPPGVNKGSTLLKLIEHEGFTPERVLCAGDTMNDLSLFETGLRGVAVGNAEAPLRRAIADLDNVYCAQRHGAGGIFEALSHFKLIPTTPIEVH